MLLVLHQEEFLSELDALEQDGPFGDFVASLGEALHNGWHAVDATPKLLDRLSRWPGLGRRAQVALRAMAKAKQLSELPLSAASHVIVVTGPAGESVPSSSSQVQYRLPWQRFTQLDWLRPSILGAENQNDARWFTLMAKSWGARLRPRSARSGREILVDPWGLGGSTARDNLKDRLAAGPPVLCVVDSDRKHPTAAAGETARHVSALLPSGPVEAPPFHVEILQACDVENLLPLGIVEQCSQGCAWLSSARARGHFVGPGRALDPALAYLDLGKDQCLGHLLETKDPATLAYRQAAVALLKSNDDTCVAQSPCVDAAGELSNCAARREDADGKVSWSAQHICHHLVQSVGKRLLPNVVTHLRTAKRPQGMPSPAAWLASELPEGDPAVDSVSQVCWSFGLRLPPAAR